MKYPVLLLLCTLAGTSFAQRTHFVMAAGTGDGTSWAAAAGDLRATLSAAAPGDEVWIAEGTYSPTTCAPCTSADLNLSFELPTGVAVYGGFAGTEGQVQDRRGGATVLSGIINPDNAAERSRTVMRVVAPNAQNLLDGLSLRHAAAGDLSLGVSDKSASGGLLYITAFQPVFEYDLRVVGCSFSDATAEGYGGAVFIDGSFDRHARVRFSDCTFERCTATRGGGAVNVSANFNGRESTHFERCRFEDNQATTEGGGAVNVQAAEFGVSTVRFNSCTLSNNRSPNGGGGALRLYGKNSEIASSNITNSVFDGNTAVFGGAVQAEGSYEGSVSASFDACTFRQNTSSKDGGAVHVFSPFQGDGAILLLDCEFAQNRANESGGAIYVNAIEGAGEVKAVGTFFRQNVAGQLGGGLMQFGKGGSAFADLSLCTFYNNRAATGGAIYGLGNEDGSSEVYSVNSAFVNNQSGLGGALFADAGDASGSAKTTLINSVFEGNRAPTSPDLHSNMADVRISHSAFATANCTLLTTGARSAEVCDQNNFFSIANVFADTSSLDFSPRPGSILVDSGVDSVLLAERLFFDATDNLRFRGSAIDLGPVELASDPLLLKETSLPDSLRLCEGGRIDLSASLYPNYGAQYTWQIGGVSQPETGLTLSRNGLTANETYTLLVSALGEVVSFSVPVSVLPLEAAAVSPTASNADTVCVGATTSLSVDLPPSSAAIDIAWRDVTGTLLSRNQRFDYQADAAGFSNFTVEAVFMSPCATPDRATTQISIEAKACVSSSTSGTSDSDFRVFPNPVYTELQVNLPEPEALRQYRVIEFSGRTVAFGMIGARNTTVDLSNLKPGGYTITVFGDNNSYQAFFLKL